MFDDRSLRYQELMTGDYPPPAPLIKGLIDSGAVANWSGLWGAGKTWLALCAARAVASGTSFLCHFPVIQGDVLMLDQESDPGGIQARLKALNVDASLPADLPIIFRFLNNVRVDDLTGFEKIDRIIGEHKPALVFMDSWIRFMSANENSSTAVALVNSNIRSLVLAHGCSVVILDHIRKSPGPGITDYPESRTRGSGEKIGFTENALTIERSREDRDLLIVHPLKRRYGEMLQPFSVRFSSDELAGSVDLRYEGEVTADQTGKPGEILEAIKRLKEQTEDPDIAGSMEIAAFLGWSESKARRALKELEPLELVIARQVRPKSGKGNNKTVYDVPEKPVSQTDEVPSIPPLIPFPLSANGGNDGNKETF